MGQGNGLGAEGAYMPQDEAEKPTPESCPHVSTWLLWHGCPWCPPPPHTLKENFEFFLKVNMCDFDWWKEKESPSQDDM